MSNPKLNEKPLEYFDRMLGKPGSIQRKLSQPYNYQYYLMIWDAFHRNKQQEKNGVAMNFQKITTGFVIQVFDQMGECISQEFVAGDECDYETEDGDRINVMDMPLGGREYFPFDMIQSDNA